MVTATTQDAGWQISPMLVGATKACLRSQALQKPDWDGEEKHEGDLAETWLHGSARATYSTSTPTVQQLHSGWHIQTGHGLQHGLISADSKSHAMRHRVG
ncbi:TPA: hypothetical protein ACH3X2_000424 [Trebouxia sp. C0005]